MTPEKISNLLLRISVAFAFLYPPFDALTNPDSWIGYFPKFMQGYVPDLVLLHGFGIVEVVIALWILSGKQIFWPSIVATLMLSRDHIAQKKSDMENFIRFHNDDKAARKPTGNVVPPPVSEPQPRQQATNTATQAEPVN